MDARIAFGLLAAWLGDGPALNHPRPQAAKPAPSVVIPAGYFDEGNPSIVPFVPPAPLPSFYSEELPQIRFEFSRLESCSDSKLNPPAPPAELETADSPKSFVLPDGKTYRVRNFEIRLESEGAPDAADDCTAGEDPRPAPAELPKTVDQLHHLQSAYQHLDAAGLTGEARQLRDRHRVAVAQLRGEIEQRLAAKEAELQRLTAEIAHLKADLVGDAELTFQVELYSVDLVELRKLANDAALNVAAAARVLLDLQNARHLPNSVDAAKQREALRQLAERNCVQVLSRPQIRMQNGGEAEVRQGVPVPRTPTDDPRQQELGTILKVKAEVGTTGQIQTQMHFQYNDPENPGETDRTAASLSLSSGQTVCLCRHVRSNGQMQPDGSVLSHEEMRLVLITPRIIRRDEPSPTIIGIIEPGAKDRVRLTDASESSAPAWEPAPRPEPEILPNPPLAPFHLIPSPATLGRPTLLFPTAPMRAVDGSPDDFQFELPPAPLPAEDPEEDPVA